MLGDSGPTEAAGFSWHFCGTEIRAKVCVEGRETCLIKDTWVDSMDRDVPFREPGSTSGTTDPPSMTQARIGFETLEFGGHQAWNLCKALHGITAPIVPLLHQEGNSRHHPCHP